MSEKDIERWSATINPRDKAPQPWTFGSGGSWDMLEVQPIPDEMLAELAQRYHRGGTPWNCRSMPLSDSDREYMYLLYSSMQGLVARMRQAERRLAELEQQLRDAVMQERERWRNAVMLELDSNGQAHAIVAAAIRAGAPAREWRGLSDLDEIRHSLTGDEGEEDSLTVLHGLVQYVERIWPGKTALEVLLSYEELIGAYESKRKKQEG